MKKFYSIVILLSVFTLSFNAQNTPPIIVNDTVYGMSGINLSIDILEDIIKNDYDVEGDNFILNEVKASYSQTWPQLEIEDTGFISYSHGEIPTNMYSDYIEYQLRETDNPEIFSEWGRIILIFEPNPDLPFAAKDFAITTAGIPVSLNVTENDLVNDYDSLYIFNWVENLGSQMGKESINNDGDFTFIPSYVASGIARYRYMIDKLDDDEPWLAWGEIEIQVNPAHFADSLDINNINAGIRADGYLFSDIIEIPDYYVNHVKPHFEYPAGSGKSTIFCSSLWIGGIDENQNLCMAAQRYKQYGIDYQAGPVSNSYDTAYRIKWNKLWKVDKEDIFYHRNNYWKEDYIPVTDIIDWPGNGDDVLGQAAQLAPYSDKNNNGTYEPMQGDYPLIRGDQSVYFIFNDDRVHTETQGDSLKVEIHGMAYAFNAPDDNALNNSIFVHYDIINRSETDYSSTYIGSFSDADIGYSSDDYVLSDVTNNSYIAYNGVDIDGHGEEEAYGENPPAQSITIIAGPIMDSDEIDNSTGGCDFSYNGLNFGDGIVDNERLGMTKFVYFNNTSSAQGDPQIATEYYNYLRGLWKDQTNMQYGGIGHIVDPGAVGPECNYMFPGDSDPINLGTNCSFPNGGYNQNNKYWTEETGYIGNPNPPGDRRGVVVTGPITFKSGDVQELDMAYVVGHGDNGPMSSVDDLVENLNSIFEKVDKGEIIIPTNELSVGENINNSLNIIVSPNPVSDLLNLRATKGLNSSCKYEIFSITGNQVLQGEFKSISTIAIDVEILNSGLYVIVVQVGNAVFSTKFIKQ